MSHFSYQSGTICHCLSVLARRISSKPTGRDSIWSPKLLTLWPKLEFDPGLWVGIICSGNVLPSSGAPKRIWQAGQASSYFLEYPIWPRSTLLTGDACSVWSLARLYWARSISTCVCITLYCLLKCNQRSSAMAHVLRGQPSDDIRDNTG